MRLFKFLVSRSTLVVPCRPILCVTLSGMVYWELSLLNKVSNKKWMKLITLVSNLCSGTDLWLGLLVGSLTKQNVNRASNKLKCPTLAEALLFL